MKKGQYLGSLTLLLTPQCLGWHERRHRRNDPTGRNPRAPHPPTSLCQMSKKNLTIRDSEVQTPQTKVHWHHFQDVKAHFALASISHLPQLIWTFNSLGGSHLSIEPQLWLCTLKSPSCSSAVYCFSISSSVKQTLEADHHLRVSLPRSNSPPLMILWTFLAPADGCDLVSLNHSGFCWWWSSSSSAPRTCRFAAPTQFQPVIQWDKIWEISGTGGI